VLASLALFGLGIFGPGIATGLVSGAPQLGAGAAVGTGLAVAGLGAGAVIGAGGALGASSRMLGALSRGGSSVMGAAFKTSSTSSVAAEGSASAASSGAAPPAWAQRMKRGQAINHGVSTAAHAVRSGDSAAGGASVNLSEKES